MTFDHDLRGGRHIEVELSHFTGSTGTPRIAPITSYSHTPLGTGEPAQKAERGLPADRDRDRHLLGRPPAAMR